MAGRPHSSGGRLSGDGTAHSSGGRLQRRGTARLKLPFSLLQVVPGQRDDVRGGGREGSSRLIPQVDDRAPALPAVSRPDGPQRHRLADAREGLDPGSRTCYKLTRDTPPGSGVRDGFRPSYPGFRPSFPASDRPSALSTVSRGCRPSQGGRPAVRASGTLPGTLGTSHFDGFLARCEAWK